MRISDWSSDVCSSDLPLHRGDALPAELALLGQQGGLRPLRARLAPYLRASGCHQQLLQQLRPLPVSREADPADDPFGAAGPASAGLWQGRERARLAARGRSEEHTSELQSLIRISYAVFCLKKKNKSDNRMPTTALNINKNQSHK